MDDNNKKDQIVDGARIAAQILMRLEPKAQERIVQAIGENAPAVLKKVQEKMVTLDDLTELTQQSIQILLKEIDHNDLVAALKVANPAVKNAIYQSVPERKRIIIEEDLELARGISPLEVQNAEKRIVIKFDQLKEQGKIRSEVKTGKWA
jgi:flagellar motor switch protein FliG